MKKLIFFTLFSLLFLAGCKKSPEPKAAYDSDAEEAEIMVSIEIDHMMEEALKTDDFKTFNAKLDALMEKYSNDKNIKANIYGSKFMALLFDEDFSGLQKMVEEIDDPDLKAEYTQCLDEAPDKGTVKLTKAQFCYSFGLEERGDAIVDDIVQNEDKKATKVIALIMSAKKYYAKKDIENFKKTMESAIAIDPSNEICRALSKEMDLAGQKMMSEDTLSEEEAGEALE